MTGTSQGGRKAGETTPTEVKAEGGRTTTGANTLNTNQQKKNAPAQKAADTRKKEDPQTFGKMGHEGGKASGGGQGSGSQPSGGKGREN